MLSFLQIDGIPEYYQKLSLTYTAIAISQTLTYVIVDTFLILYLLEFLSFRELGIAIAIQLLVSGLLDYPTGALADKFGHGRILIVGYLFIIPGGLILFIFQSIQGVIFAFILISIGRSQESGALDSYFDNRYRIGAEEFDKESKIFGAFKSRVFTINHFLAGISFIISGLIATLINRRFLILLHVLSAVITLFLIVKLIGFAKPIVETETMRIFEHVKGGIKFFLSKSSIFYFYFGISLSFAASSAIWYSQLLFPFYYGYSGSDFFTGLLRSVNFILGLSIMLLVPKMSRKITNERFWFIVALSYTNPIFFFVSYSYYVLVPPTQTFVLLPFVSLIGVYFIFGFGDTLTGTLLNRIQLEIVPSGLRNSIYSLIPTIVTLSGVPLAILGGWVISTIGFAEGILLCTILSFFGALLAGYGVMRLDEGKYSSTSVFQ